MTLAINVTKADVDALLTAAGLATDVLQLSVQPLIVRTPDRVLLFDTGNGPSGMLSASMATAGVEPAEVTDIFISHSHGDHVGGLVDADGALAFPNADIHISVNEWAAMQANAQLASLVKAISTRVVAFEPGADRVPGTVKAVDIQGHTPGHSGFLITSGEASLLYIDRRHDAPFGDFGAATRLDHRLRWRRSVGAGKPESRACLRRRLRSARLLGALPFPGSWQVREPWWHVRVGC